MEKTNIVRDFLEDIEEVPAPRLDRSQCLEAVFAVTQTHRHVVACLTTRSQRWMISAARMFWPKEIWGLYGDALADFKDPGNASQAVQ
ncbi:hypothetical protein WJX77_007767 [Trebouxia sp. C0004]